MLATALLAAALLPLRSQEDKRVAVYAPQASYSVSVFEKQKTDYVGLFESVEPLGDASLRIGGKSWRLRFNGIDCEFRPDRDRVRIGRAELTMAAPFLVDGDRGFVPLQSLPTILSRLLNLRVDYHVTSRRIFAGDTATRFTVEVKKGEGAVLSFSAPVNPTVSTEPGKLRMTFSREPLTSTTGTFQFQDDKLISSVQYNEVNGAAELVVQTNAPVIAHFADGGKTIRLVPTPVQAQAPAPPPAVAAAPSPAPTEGVPVTAQPASPAAAAGAAVGALHQPYLVVLDASHGGDERGAALDAQLAEKDVTLAFARKLRGELQARGLNTLMLRDSDATLSLEQRAETANASRAAVYVSLHASSMGSGVRLYTALLPDAPAQPAVFMPWESAQATHLQVSRVLAQAVAAEADKRELAASIVPAPVRPLNNLVSAAIAVEVSPPNRQVAGLNNSSYQQQVAAAIATGIANARERLEGAR